MAQHENLHLVGAIPPPGKAEQLQEQTHIHIPERQNHARQCPNTDRSRLTLSVDVADRLRPAGVARPLLAMFSALDPYGIPTPCRWFGPDHPDTLTTRSNLARWRGEAGDAAGAASLFEGCWDVARPGVPSRDHTVRDSLMKRGTVVSWWTRADDASYEHDGQ